MSTPLAGASMLVVNAPVMVRVSSASDRGGREYPSRIEDLEPDLVVVAAPAGANSALLASGSREVELSWLSPRGRYEQHCRLVHSSAPSGGPKQWRLRPLRQPVLIQRRRYIRVRASLEVTLDLGADTVRAATVDVSEGGFRVRMPRRDIPDLQHTVVRATIGTTKVAIPGYVLRTTDADAGQTEAVVAFEAEGSDAEAVRRFILHMQLRARAKRDS